MKRPFCLLFIFVALLTISLSQAVTVGAQETASIEVAQGAICRDVVNREPVGAGTSFYTSVGKLWCWTRIVGAQSPIEIIHVWYWDDTERARVTLWVGSASWRTYSSKIIQAHEVGDWHVDVIGPGGEILDRLRFNITQY